MGEPLTEVRVAATVTDVVTVTVTVVATGIRRSVSNTAPR